MSTIGLLKAAGLAGILIAASASVSPALQAAQLNGAAREGQAVVSKLSANASAITYWVSAADGWHAVTTVDIVTGRDSDAEKHTVLRFSSVLLPGQSQLISVPVPMGEQPKALRIRRLGDRIEVAPVPGSA